MTSSPSRATRVIATAESSNRSPGVAAAATSILESKLYLPRRRSDVVARPALVERIQSGCDGRLTLVSAPAGFGKTTLLAEWLAAPVAGGRAAGWVSLDPGDNEPTRFWTYVIHALRTAHPALGTHPLSLLHSPQPPPIESVLTALIHEIHGTDADFVLVLDDYHVIEAPAIHAGLTFLIDHLPSRMRLVLASRTEPPLPLSRLRARGELTELRLADLRFTLDEATAFLVQVMALALSAEDLATLERRTEGWIAALKLAALSMKGRGDVHQFVQAFSGDHRHIADYLVDEVLQAQPERIRRFLLGTAILDRLSGPLCDTVTDEPGSQALLETLERRNLFVVPLDDRREWYRYHHLFAAVLQAHATREDPVRVRTVHGRASGWYERNGAHGDAVRHAIAAGDLDRAAGLLETAWPERDRSYETSRWLDRVRALPDAVVRARPVLSMGLAWALLNRGDLEAAEARMADVERWADAAVDPSRRSEASATGMVIVDEARFGTLPAELASARVYLAQSRGDVAGTIEHARRSLDLVPDDDPLARATGVALLGLAYWGNGELETAHGTFAEALALMRRGGHTLAAIRGTFVLGDIRMAQGRLRDAAGSYEGGLRFAAEQGLSAAAETDELHLGLSEVYREWGDLESAERLLRTIPESAEHAGNRLRRCTAMAKVREALGDLPGALELLDEAEGLRVRDPLPRVRPIAALKARVRIAQGRLGDAVAWVDARGLTADDGLSYLREFEHATLARVLLARGEAARDSRSLEAGARLLERLRDEAEVGGRTGSVIEMLLLQALSHQARGNVRGALEPLERALTLAEPEGHLRIFVDEGGRMRDLLRHAAARGLAGEHVRRLLTCFDAPSRPVESPASPRDPAPMPVLTARELEILRLVAAGMRNQEIARQLFISPATVKRHIANTYVKLGARHRTEALVRARALHLL